MRKGTEKEEGKEGGKQKRKHRMKRNAKLREIYQDRKERNEPDKDNSKRGRNKRGHGGKKKGKVSNT